MPHIIYRNVLTPKVFKPETRPEPEKKFIQTENRPEPKKKNFFQPDSKKIFASQF